MYKSIKFFAIFSTFLLLNGCASSCGSSVETNTNNKNGEVIVPKKADNAKVPTNNNATVVNGLDNANKKNPTLDGNVEVKEVDTSKIKSEPLKRKAPNNSSVSSKSVGKSFVEVREFADHPQLVKVEKTFSNAEDIKYKVYLKDGKTVDGEDSKLKNYRKMTPSDILKAVGVKPVETKNSGNNDSKKEEQEKLQKKPNS